MPKKGSRYAQPILHFYCRPCAEYHHKEHPHYEEMKQRAAERKRKVRKPKTATKA
jgi:hypothetical protein